MNRNFSKIILIGFILLIFSLDALCQNSQVRWYSFNMGYNKSVETHSAVQSIVGQNIIGFMQQSNTQVISGFLADTLFRGTIVDVKNQDQLPTSYSLWQNYPNPFNPSTTIHFELPKESHVILKIYNILGQEVLAVLDEEKVAGKYNLKIEGTSLASGVYFYRLTTGDYIATKKLILMK